MLVLSPKVRNFDIKVCMLILNKCDLFPSLTRCSTEWFQLHEVKMSNDYELYYFQKTNSKEDEIHINLRDLIDKGNYQLSRFKMIITMPLFQEKSTTACP